MQPAVRFLLPAVQHTVGACAEITNELVRHARSGGLTLSPEDAAQIVTEVKQHPEQVRGALAILKEAFTDTN